MSDLRSPQVSGATQSKITSEAAQCKRVSKPCSIQEQLISDASDISDAANHYCVRHVKRQLYILRLISPDKTTKCVREQQGWHKL